MNSERGFTMIELLVVMTIIGILASTGIVSYSRYKERAFDSRAVSDLRNAMSAQEAYFSTHEVFLDNLSNLEGFDTASPSVTVVLTVTAQTWRGSSYHPQGANTFCYDSGSTEIVQVPGKAQTCP